MELPVIPNAAGAEPLSVKKQAEKPDQPPVKKELPPSNSYPTKSAGETQNLEAVAEGINNFLKKMKYSLQFVVDRKNGQVTVKVLDEEGNLVRQIPPQAMASLPREGGMTGMILNETLR